MKLYFETENFEEDCITPCPFDRDCMIGSVACQECKHCYGAQINKLEPHCTIDQNKEVKFNANYYIFCAAAENKSSFKIRLKKFIYKIIYRIKEYKF